MGTWAGHPASLQVSVSVSVTELIREVVSKVVVRITEVYKNQLCTECVFQGTGLPCWMMETVMSTSSAPPERVPRAQSALAAGGL